MTTMAVALDRNFFRHITYDEGEYCRSVTIVKRCSTEVLQTHVSFQNFAFSLAMQAEISC